MQPEEYKVMEMVRRDKTKLMELGVVRGGRGKCQDSEKKKVLTREKEMTKERRNNMTWCCGSRILEPFIAALDVNGN